MARIRVTELRARAKYTYLFRLIIPQNLLLELANLDDFLPRRTVLEPSDF